MANLSADISHIERLATRPSLPIARLYQDFARIPAH